MDDTTCNFRLHLWIILLSSALLLFCNGVTFAQEAENRPNVDSLDELTKRVIAKELELQRLNAHFRLESSRQPRWRPWRQFVYSETNAGCTEAGLIARMALSYPYMRKPATIYKLVTVKTVSAGQIHKAIKLESSVSKAPGPSSQLVERAATTQMIGQLVGTVGDAFELSSDLIKWVKDGKHSFDAKTFASTMRRNSTELEELLAEREKLIQTSVSLSSGQLQFARAEGAVLHDLRDLTLLQYAQYHSGAWKLRFFQNAAYLLNITKNASGVAGNLVNLESTHLKQPKLAGTASLLTAVAGSVIIATPIVGRVSGNLAGLVDRRIVSHDFVDVQAHQASEFIRDRQVFSRLLVQSDPRPHTAIRGDIYETEEKLLLKQKGNLEREQRLARETTVENVVFGTLVGGSRISQGVLGMVGAWHFYNKPWMNSRLSAAGATAYGAGTTFNILETARVKAQSEIYARKLGKQQLLPSQVVQDRIDSLDAMEKSLVTLASSPRADKEARLGTTY